VGSTSAARLDEPPRQLHSPHVERTRPQPPSARVHCLGHIHPFGDGNGRTARLVADWILQRHGLPPATFSKSKRNILAVFGQGVEALEKAKVIGAIKAVDRGVQRTLEIYRSQLGASAPP
jgi:hypothetical protein